MSCVIPWQKMIWGCWVCIRIPNTDLVFQQHLKTWLSWLLLVRISFGTVTWTWDAFEVPTSRPGAVCCIRPQVQGQSQGVIQKPRLLLQRWVSFPKLSSMSIQELGKLLNGNGGATYNPVDSTQHQNARAMSEARRKWRDLFCMSGNCKRRIFIIQLGNWEWKAHAGESKVKALTLIFRENHSFP